MADNSPFGSGLFGSGWDDPVKRNPPLPQPSSDPMAWLRDPNSRVLSGPLQGLTPLQLMMLIRRPDASQQGFAANGNGANSPVAPDVNFSQAAKVSPPSAPPDAPAISSTAMPPASGTVVGVPGAIDGGMGAAGLGGISGRWPEQSLPPNRQRQAFPLRRMRWSIPVMQMRLAIKWRKFPKMPMINALKKLH